MLKCWRDNFDPTQDYFHFRHLWVLLPGLPMHLWNVKSLEAIGNVLGRFIKVYEHELLASDKRMCKVLVELDIHSGLLESLEIVWRGHTMCQKLDYLGIPFSFFFGRKIDHLRRDCQGYVEEEQSKDIMLKMSTRSDSPGVDSLDFNTSYSEAQGANESEFSDTVTGKLKTICPTLFFSFSAWE